MRTLIQFCLQIDHILFPYPPSHDGISKTWCSAQQELKRAIRNPCKNGNVKTKRHFRPGRNLIQRTSRHRFEQCLATIREWAHS